MGFLNRIRFDDLLMGKEAHFGVRVSAIATKPN